MNLLNTIAEFCIKHDLISEYAGRRIAVENERWSGHPIQLMIQSGVNETKLYETVSREYDIPVIDSNKVSQLTSAKGDLDDIVSNQFDCVSIGSDDNQINILTWNWLKIESIQKGIENITGKKVDLKLAPPSIFNQI